MEHTPGPWATIHRQRSGFKLYADRAPAENQRNSIGVIDGRDDAAFIVRACNAHDDLIKAMSALLAAADADGWPPGWGMVREYARAALAKAAP